jgi:hypothetical protein
MKVRVKRNWFTRTKAGFLIALLLLGIFNYPGLVPWTSASETAIDTDVSADYNAQTSTGTSTVFTSDTTGYTFYVDGDDSCVFKKTTNSGSTWSAEVDIDTAGDCRNMSIWYDRWTPGDTTGNYIYIAWISNATDGLHFNRVDTGSGDAVWISAGSRIDLNDAAPDYGGGEAPSITKGTDGDLYIGVADDVDGMVYKCTGSCDSAGNWAEAASGTNPFAAEDTGVILLPQASGNIMAIQHDNSADDYESRLYTDGSNTWAGSWTDIDSNATETFMIGGMSATVDPVTYDIYFAYNAWNDDDLRTAIYTGGTWSARQPISDNTPGEANQVSLAFNRNNGDIYAAFMENDAPADDGENWVYYVKSTNKMQSWSNRSAALNASMDIVRGVHLNMISDQRIYVTWVEGGDDSIYGDTIADLSPTTAEQAAYRVFDGANTTGSAWWNSSWLNRKKITVDNTGSTENLDDFTVRVSLSALNIDYGKTKAGGADIRFVDSDNSTSLKYEIERWNSSGTSEIWVKIPRIDANSAGDYFWMYYNNTGASDGQDAQNTWDSASKAIYHMNFDPTPAGGGAGCESGTKEICDSTANNNDGDSGGSMTSGDLVTGTPCIDRCIDFDGTDDNFLVPDHNSLDITSTITLSGWGIFPSTASWMTMMIKETSSDGNYALQGNGDAVGFTWFEAGDAYREIWSPNWPTPGQPYFFAATFTTTGDQVCIYQNGDQNWCEPETGTLTANTQGLKIGESAAGEHWQGYMDELRIVSGIRSPEWIEAEYLTGTNRYLSYGSEESYVNASLSALAAANTAATASPATDPFRLRLLLHFGGDGLRTGLTDYKLQYAAKSGTCDTGFSGETYSDVGTGDIKFNDVAAPTDGALTGSVSGDATHSSDLILPQSVEEGNNFTNSVKVYGGQDALWDFSLIDTSHTSGKDYCFRVVTSGGSTINTYTQVPELQQPSVGGAMRHGNYFNGNGVEEGSIW